MARTVVLIDDDPDDLQDVKEVLLDVDSTLICVSFTHPLEAVRLLTDGMILLPDFIFVDINMPRMSGPDCLVSLRSVNELKSSYIVMYSTTLRPDLSRDLLLKGANYTFQKPYTTKDYLRILEGIIYKKITSPSHIS
jgi:CheY-like chemotaxis protein